ncbi:hypothetical protein LINPERHAP2_LOCUS37184 [Linum perenne]
MMDWSRSKIYKPYSGYLVFRLLEPLKLKMSAIFNWSMMKIVYGVAHVDQQSKPYMLDSLWLMDLFRCIGQLEFKSKFIGNFIYGTVLIMAKRLYQEQMVVTGVHHHQTWHDHIPTFHSTVTVNGTTSQSKLVGFLRSFRPSGFFILEIGLVSRTALLRDLNPRLKNRGSLLPEILS